MTMRLDRRPITPGDARPLALSSGVFSRNTGAISHEYDAYNAKLGRRDLYIAIVGTRAAGRKRGIATALLVTAMAAGRADGYESASLAVDADSLTGAVRLYEARRVRGGHDLDHLLQAARLTPGSADRWMRSADRPTGGFIRRSG